MARGSRASRCAKTDACCARYSFPVFKALAAAAPEFGIDVLQCTHIGGCHFAPSVIVMPDRQRYGRLMPAAVPDFLATIARNDLYMPAYKGQSGTGRDRPVRGGICVPVGSRARRNQ